MSHLLIAFALLFVTGVNPAQIEMGTIDCGHSANWPRVSNIPNKPNVGERAIDVGFSGSYSKPPKVFLSISELDVDKEMNLRVTSSVVSVYNSFFRAACLTWHDTVVHSMKLNWMSVYE